MSLDTNHDNHISPEEVRQESLHILDRIVSLFIYTVAIILVGYMLGSLVRSLIDFYYDIFGLFDPASVAQGLDITLQQELLHTIAFTIVLVKAYRILISYAKTQHLNIEFLIKLAIAAPIVEIVFNSHSYDFVTLLFLGAFGLITLIIYLYFYTRIRTIVKDHVFDLSRHERG